MSPSPPLAASGKYKSINALLRASMAQIPVAISGITQIFEFADPAFKDFVIRKKGFDDILSTTTTLTPVDYIFHGPNIGAPLFEGKDRSDGYSAQSNISILLKQPGDTIENVLDIHGVDAVTTEIAQHPTALEKLFRTTAFVGAFEKSYNAQRLSLSVPATLDVHKSNIMLDLNPDSLGLIDQMNRENIKRGLHTKLDFDKARNSIENYATY